MKKNIKILCISVIVVCSLFLNLISVSANNVITSKIIVNNLLQTINPRTITIDDSLFISFRDFGTVIDAEVIWDSKNRFMNIKKDDKILKIYPDTNKGFLNQNKSEINITCKIIDGYTYIPLRSISEILGFNVGWDPTTKTVSLNNQKSADLLNTSDLSYLYLFDYEKGYSSEEDIISFDEALKLAKENNSSLKNFSDKMNNLYPQIKTTGENLSTAQFSLNPTSENLIALARKLKKLHLEETRKDINKQQLDDMVELTLLNSLNSIKTSLMDIDVLKQNIAISEQNVKNAELKLSLGMENQFNVNTMKTNLQKFKSSLESLQLTLDTNIKNLKQIIGTDKYVALSSVNVTFKELDNFDLEHYINIKKSSDISIIKLQDQVDLAKYNLDTYIQANEEKKDNETVYNTTIRELNDGKDDLEKNINIAYSNIMQLAENNKTLLKNLEQAKEGYNKVALAYSLGNATSLDVEKSKLEILNAEKELENNKLVYSIALFRFYKPYLLG